MTIRKVYGGPLGPYIYDDEELINDPDEDFEGEYRAALVTDGDVVIEGDLSVATLTLTGLTASRLVVSDANKALASLASLSDYIAGTTSQVTVTDDDSDGTITLSLPQNIHTSATPTFARSTLTDTCLIAAGANFLRVTGLQTDATAMTGTLRGGYIDVSNGSTAATGTIRALELKARTEAPGDTGSNVTVLEGLSISADSKDHSVTTMRAAEFIIDGSSGGTITEAVGLRIANNLQANKATASYGLQIYRDSFDYTYDISLSLGGHITGDSYINQDLRVTASPIFVGGTFSAVVTGIIPTAGAHLATKEYVDLAIGSSKDFFMSDTDDAVVADTHVMYVADTGEDASTILGAGKTAGDNQLIFSFLSEAGEPGITMVRPGVYELHTHLHKGSGDPTTVFYWTLSKVAANGSSSVVLLMSSETSSEIPASTPGSFETHAFLATGVAIGVTDRYLLRYYINVTGGGTSEVTVTMEGTHDCHLSVKVPSDVWQNQGNVLDDLNTLGAVEADSEFLVGTAAGVLDWESGATVRASLGITALMDNSMADALHRHSELSASDGTPDQALVVDAEGNSGLGTLTPGKDLVGTFDYASTVKLAQIDGVNVRLILRGSAGGAVDFFHTAAGVNGKWMQLRMESGITYFQSVSDGAVIIHPDIFVMDHITGNVGFKTTTPQGNTQWSDEDTHGGFVLKTYGASSGTLTNDHTITIQVNVPSGAKLIGAQLHVKTALVGGETWNAQYVTGATQSIGTAQAVAQNTNLSTFFDVNTATDIASGEVDITLQRSSDPGVDAFTAQGEIEAVVYAYIFDTWDNDDGEE